MYSVTGHPQYLCVTVLPCLPLYWFSFTLYLKISKMKNCFTLNDVWGGKTSTNRGLNLNRKEMCFKSLRDTPDILNDTRTYLKDAVKVAGVSQIVKANKRYKALSFFTGTRWGTRQWHNLITTTEGGKKNHSSSAFFFFYCMISAVFQHYYWSHCIRRYLIFFNSLHLTCPPWSSNARLTTLKSTISSILDCKEFS